MGHNTCKSMGRVLCVVRRYISGCRCCPLVTNMTTMFVDIVAMLHLLAAVFKQSLAFRFMKPLGSVAGDWSRLGEQSSKSL